MCVIYLKRCETCDAEGPDDVSSDGSAGAVITEGRDGGEFISDGYLALLKPDGELAPFVPNIAISLYLRLRYHEDVKPVRFEQCVNCGSPKAVAVANARKTLFPCQRCGQKSVRVDALDTS
jgi:hypothetical protein